jgi:hypothetical protein
LPGDNCAPDSWPPVGNRTSQEAAASAFQSGSGGLSACLPANPQPLTYNASNQINGGPGVPSYDQAGNILSDNNGDGNTYLYDMISVVALVSGTLYTPTL